MHFMHADTHKMRERVKNLPPGGRWPSEARSEEECGRKAQSQQHPKTCRNVGHIPKTGASLDILQTFRFLPAFLFSPQSVPKSRLATARNCGVIAPGNHWILDSLRGAPPPGEAIGAAPRHFDDQVQDILLTPSINKKGEVG